MTGFSLYETFRFVIPGAIAAALVSLTLRLAIGSGAMYSEGPAKGLVAELATARTFLFVALSFGFILYALDLPVRARIYEEGDPEHGYLVPSNTLDKMLSACRPQEWLAGKTLSVYFLLMDAHFPTELHKKVYFFGGLYRIYFDARVLIVTALTLGPVIGLVALRGDPSSSEFHRTHALVAAISIILSIAAGAVATVLHRNASKARRVRRGDLTPHEYLKRLRQALREAGWVAAFIVGAQASALTLAMQGAVGVRIIGLGMATTALICWVLFEFGPPPVRTPHPKTGELPPRSVRALILNRLRCPDSPETQFIPAQRALVDAALMAPAMIAATNLTIEQGRSANAVLWWALLLGIGTFIVVSRKHEVRLLNSFRDQSTWLSWNRKKIEMRAQDLAPDDAWA
ncbi:MULTISPECIES: hypothetical protein [unclassified Knoellia]|uniref:hypothetical protein n=1 Tax=Knoellia altitudinis TaxID=3404795 RepID=UPI00360BEC07